MHIFFVLICFVSAAMGSALAQTINCNAYQNELDNLSRNMDPRSQEYLLAAQRQRAELQRTRAYYEQIGCSRADLYRRPPECSSLNENMRQMQANLNEMLAYAERLGGGRRNYIRRQELQAALDRYCTHEPAQPRGFFDRLLGITKPGQPFNQSSTAEPMDFIDEETESGGSQPVCVRLVDGYFFPLGTSYRGRDQAQRMCQAQCPGSRTELFFMAQGGVIEKARSAAGAPYGSLPSALAYQKRTMADAFCLPPGQSWAQALQDAEMLIGRHGGDIIVTAEKAKELSMPTVSSIHNNKQSNKKVSPVATNDSDVIDARIIPTAGVESAGIGPDLSSVALPLANKEGGRRYSTTSDGEERLVRIIAPHLIPIPEMQRH